jgi:antirestriction protein ArdC
MKRTTRVKPDLYQVVTDKVIALLEAGTVPWQRSWNQYGLARNYATGHVYTGINAFLLNFFPSFEKAIPMPRTFHLFNIADVDGIDFDIPELKENPSAPIEACDNFMASLQAVPEVCHDDLNHAYYTPKADRINMPPLPRFHSPEAYYKTLFHETTHSTGHDSRLSRPGITLPKEQRKPGSETHAQEELIAELGAVYLCHHAGITRQPLQENAAAYIDGYLGLLKNDKRFLFQASSQAQKAVNFLLEAPT